ncbi:MAG TPA: SRPBCC domain-containing protein [Polyangia bacterium]|nr:SRPBCC domain-containing protein [Polyangia bacterium]
MFTIDSTIDIAAPPARVRTAITTEAGYRAWLAQDADFDGKQMTLRFSLPSETRSVTFQVDRCDGSGTVMTCVAHANNADWIGTTLAIELGETPTGTRVHLVHAGYRAKNEVYERSGDAWPYFLRSLARYIMTGTGAPYPKAAQGACDAT